MAKTIAEIYSSEIIAEKLQSLNQALGEPWILKEGHLHKTFTFPDFISAFAFMTKVAILAEKANHHPDWSNVYNRVEINLMTHHLNGITEKDFQLAKKIG